MEEMFSDIEAYTDHMKELLMDMRNGRNIKDVAVSPENDEYLKNFIVDYEIKKNECNFSYDDFFTSIKIKFANGYISDFFIRDCDVKKVLNDPLFLIRNYSGLWQTIYTAGMDCIVKTKNVRIYDLGDDNYLLLPTDLNSNKFFNLYYNKGVGYYVFHYAVFEKVYILVYNFAMRDLGLTLSSYQ